MANTPHPWLSYQPTRLIFHILYTATILLRLPYYVVTSMIPSLRANKNWTMRQNLSTRVFRPLLDSVSRAGVTNALSLEPGREGKRFQIVPAAASKFFKGPLIEFKDICPAKIGATWYPERGPKDLSDKKVVYYLHGGAFVHGDGRTLTCGPFTNYFLKPNTGDYVFSLQYRLSGHGGLNPYPAALQDAVSGYVMLLNEFNVSPENIILSGDSAGGNLASALLRYLAEYGTDINLPSPKCAILLSPWIDPVYRSPTSNPQYITDYVTGTFGSKFNIYFTSHPY